MNATSRPNDTDRSPDDRSSDDRPESNREALTTTTIDATRDARTQTVLGVLAVLATTGAFYRLLDLPGILAGIVVAVCWYRLSAEATFAFGTVVLVVAVPESPPLVGVALVEGGLLAILVSTVRQYDAPGKLLGAFVIFLAGLLAVTWTAIEGANAIWVGALVLCVTVSLLAYGQHRYVLVRTGLVEPETKEGAQ